MSLEIVPQGPEHRDLVAAFNQRLRAALGEPPFLLPLEPEPAVPSSAIRASHYVAIEDGQVRGGYRAVLYPCVLNGTTAVAVNLQSPLSESIIDKRYRHVARQMIDHVIAEHHFVFGLGMGGFEQPFPRRLRSLGWSVEQIPFFFRVHHAAAFLVEMPLLHSPWPRRWGARLAARTGLGSLGCSILHRRHRSLPRDLRVVRESSWEAWADSVWAAYGPLIRFGVKRDAAVLRELYPPNEPRLRIFRMLAAGETVGWATARLTQMRGNRHFGNLRVGTVLDAAARPDFLFAVAALADEALAAEGADLVITNQSFPRWQEAFHEAGFRRGPSNFLFAGSPALLHALSPSPVADGLVHIVRGDGAGRIHL